MTPSASCLYTGVVHHSRAEPAHAFRYRLWLVYLDLAELLQALDGGCLWSARRIALARYRRTPARPDPDADAARDVRVLLPPGDLLLLLRDGRSNADPRRRRDHEHSVAEVAGDGATLRWQFRKAFHVSPFLPMELDYDWRFTTPGERIAVRMDDRSDGRVMFDTTLAMARRPLDGRGMAAVLARHPATTVKVVAAIYWQALRLRLERAQFFAHPSSTVRGTGTP